MKKKGCVCVCVFNFKALAGSREGVNKEQEITVS